MSNKKIVWVSRHQPLNSQIAELERLFPGHTLVIENRPFKSAEQIVHRFKEVGGDEMVVVAPWSVMRHLIKLGIKPIYAEMKPTSAADAESVIIAGRSKRRRYYRFVAFHYCVDVALKFEPIHEPGEVKLGNRQTVLLDSNGNVKSVIK